MLWAWWLSNLLWKRRRRASGWAAAWLCSCPAAASCPNPQLCWSKVASPVSGAAADKQTLTAVRHEARRQRKKTRQTKRKTTTPPKKMKLAESLTEGTQYANSLWRSLSEDQNSSLTWKWPTFQPPTLQFQSSFTCAFEIWTLSWKSVQMTLW